MPQRLQRRRTPGWKQPAGAIYCGRGQGQYGRWGNPYRVDIDGTAAECVQMFVARYEHAAAYRAAVRQELAGKDLVCWCKPGDWCHGDVLLRWANETPPQAPARPTAGVQRNGVVGVGD